MHYYTYAYLREDRTPYYIGKGKGNRIYEKRKSIKPPKDKSRIIYLKQNLTEEEAFKHEIYMIAVFGRKDLGTGILYNMTDGGEGSSGGIPSEETRRKMSEAGKGKIFSKEHRRKIGESNKRRIVSAETRRKISDAHKGENNHNYGKTLSEETKRKQSEVKIGENNPNYGKSHSEETKRKISEASKGKTSSKETRIKLREARQGKKWWNDGCGNRKFVAECPGDDWKLGMK